MPLSILHAGLTDTGLVRAGNEDAWSVDPAQGLFIVADGMGGHNAGEIAAGLVVETLPVLVRSRMNRLGARSSKALARRLRSAVARVSRDVFQRAMQEPELYGMGATVVVALVRDRELVVAHLGDSRAYLLHGDRLQMLTRDHSVIQALLDSGQITADEVSTHPARNRITASVGMPGSPTPDSRQVTLEAGDKLLLCTDGLAGMISDERIGDILRAAQPPETICRALVNAANDAGGHDNITAVVVEFGSEGAT